MAENNSSAPLLPCPFCGGAAAVQKESPAGGGYFVECKSCRASTNLRYACGDNPVPLLMERWNARAPQAVAAQAAPAAVAVSAKKLASLVEELRMLAAVQEPEYPNFQIVIEEAVKVLESATPALPATEDSSAGDLAEPMFPKAYFGLGAEDIDKMRDAGLKPEEIAGDDPETQLRRVHELVWWFSRFADGNANPKWLRGHAFELAYYIACMDVKRQINLDEVRKKAFKEGAMVSPSERRSLEFTGFLPPLAAPQAQPADALDAKRYRYLREGWTYDFRFKVSDGLDEAIDAAMAAAQEGGNAAKEA